MHASRAARGAGIEAAVTESISTLAAYTDGAGFMTPTAP